jgi:hypothetical protein
MKFQPVTKSIEMFGHSEVSNMTIEASGKMFRTIISGLYSRKIESICRESIANAKDGHIKRGNPERPSYVHAPTSWEPYYSVRDFGCSMDHETVMRRFTAIGWSSKEDSNEEIGTFGLGSKAPFAYTSMFSVTTWLDGVQRTYDAFLNEEGKPMMALAAESESDEEQGLMVRFDVRTPDIHAFHKAIKFVALAHLPCFECNLEGVHSAEIDEDHGNFYFSRDVQDGPRVQIGCVTYPIDFNALDSTRATQVLRNQKNLVLRTKIGDLGVVPSREGLEYTEKTIANLNGYLADLFGGYEKEVTERCAEIKTVWEAAAYWEEISRSPIKAAIGGWTRVLDKAMHLNQAESFTVAGNARPYINKVICNSDVSVSTRAATAFARRPLMVVYVQDERTEKVKFWRRRVAADMTARGFGEAMLVTLPDPLDAVARLRKQLELTKADRKERKSKLDGLFSMLAAMRATLKGQIAAYGCPEVINLHELPEAVRPQRNPKDAPIVTYAMAKSYASFDRHDYLTLDEDKFNIVFPLKRGKPPVTVDSGATFIRRVAKDRGFDIGAIVGVAASNVKRYLAENPSCFMWTDVFNAESFDIPALKARADALASKQVVTLNDHNDLYYGILNHLDVQLGELPDSLRVFVDTYATMLAKRDADRKERKAFELAGPGMDDCLLIIRMVEGVRYEANGVTHEDLTLDGLAAQIACDFPKLAYVIDERRNYGDEAVDPLIYVLGVLALNARLAAFSATLENSTETAISPAQTALAA